MDASTFVKRVTVFRSITPWIKAKLFSTLPKGSTQNALYKHSNPGDQQLFLATSPNQQEQLISSKRRTKTQQIHLVVVRAIASAKPGYYSSNCFFHQTYVGERAAFRSKPSRRYSGLPSMSHCRSYALVLHVTCLTVQNPHLFGIYTIKTVLCLT